MVTARRPDGVFVSSVYTELKDYRKAAMDAVWRSRLVPIGMERENIAKPSTTIEASREMVDEASVYVGIFAQRCGKVTVEELRYAKEQGLYILAFLAEEQLNDHDVEPDPARTQELAAIKKELRDHHTVAYFRTTEELGAKVLRSLQRLIEDGKLASTESPQTPMEQVPTPPEPYYAHPYTGGSRFVGRRAELELLDAWATSADPTLIVEAIGGSGKSALTWEWARQHVPTVLPQRAGLVWWSFYEAQATVGKFLSHTLAYLTQRPVENCAKLPRSVQEEQLLFALRKQPVVLVLDGVERLLLAYHRHDAAHLADAVVEAEPRRCTDPRDGTLLRALTLAAPTKTLMTSRLVPQDLQTRSGQLAQGVRHLPLHGLSGDDALALLAEAGVHGDPTVMQSFLAQFGDHALLIQVLAGRIRDYKPSPGNFDAWYQAVGRDLQLGEKDLVSRQASILQAALEDLDPLDFRLLSQLAAFRYPVEYDAVVAINPYRTGTDQENWQESGLEPLHQALTTLEERGLVQWNRDSNRYDMHPVVRNYAYGKLEDKQATYAQVRDYFAALPAEDEEQVRDEADLRRTFELYNALLNGSQPDDALRLYRDRLDVLYYGLGGYATMVEMLRPLFSHGFEHPPALRTLNDQSYVINDLALAFDNLADYTQAQQLYALGIRLSLQDRFAGALAVRLGNLGDSLQESGRLAAAEHAYQLRLEVDHAADDQEGIDIAYRELTSLFTTIGAWEEGRASYNALQASPDEGVKSQPFAFVHAAQVHWGQGYDPIPFLVEALRRAKEQRFLRAERAVQRLSGEMAFASGDLGQAGEAWQAAYTIAQREGVPLGPYLADLARLHAAQRDEAQARALIGEAVILGGHGVALAAVEVFTALGEPTEARRYVEAAYREAWADGPPYAYYHELKRIRAALQTLGIPEPQLPPFDPAKVAPVPYEAEIRAFIEELKRERAGTSSAETVDSSLEMSRNADPKQNGKRPWWQFWSRR